MTSLPAIGSMVIWRSTDGKRTKVGRVVAHTGNTFVPVQVKFESVCGNWNTIAAWERGERVMDASGFLRSNFNFHTLSVSIGELEQVE